MWCQEEKFLDQDLDVSRPVLGAFFFNFFGDFAINGTRLVCKTGKSFCITVLLKYGGEERECSFGRHLFIWCG